MSTANVAELNEQLATTTSPEHSASINDEAAKAIAALSQLPDNQQEVIRLRIEHGLSYAQISEVTELSVGNVGYLLHTGLKTLRTQMND